MRLNYLPVAVALATSLSVPIRAQDDGVREVVSTGRNIIPLTLKLRYSTMIHLPDGDELLDFVCGDTANWTITPIANYLHVKPNKESAHTNLTVVAASGRTYTFLLKESSTDKADLIVYVQADPPIQGRPKFAPIAQVEAIEQELKETRAAVVVAQGLGEQAAAEVKANYPTAMRFPYEPLPYRKPFLVRGMWTDGTMTFARLDTKELPALYELKDGAASLVNFQVKDGVYVIPKVLSEGYFVIGKERLPFRTAE
jgi:hypothetical protein